MNDPITHSRDKVIKHKQKRVVATCGMRVVSSRTIYGPSLVDESPITCTGCVAILREREREVRQSQRAATPGQHETEDPSGEIR
jgi:hypothetical protein